jgi:3-keto-5-aminohexanoate cleavage enzyme
MSTTQKRKIIVTVAPVSHVGKKLPDICVNPLTPDEIAVEAENCAKAGASMIHLHVRDLTGEQTFDLGVFDQTLTEIRKRTDMIIQGSTGGLSNFTLEERCVCLNDPRVEVASLNMGSVNFGDSVYINTVPDIAFWAQRMRETNVVPEMECFDLSHVEGCTRLADKGIIDRPLHLNFCLGNGSASALAMIPRNLFFMKSVAEEGAHFGLNHDTMPGLEGLATAITMGASTVRVGFEDSVYYAPGKVAKNNAELVEKLVAMIRAMGLEVATPAEAREMMGIKPL